MKDSVKIVNPMFRNNGTDKPYRDRILITSDNDEILRLVLDIKPRTIPILRRGLKGLGYVVK